MTTAMRHPAGAQRGLQRLRLRRAHRCGDRTDHLGGVRQRPRCLRARAPAELQGRCAATVAFGGEGRAAARMAGPDRRPVRGGADRGVAARARAGRGLRPQAEGAKPDHDRVTRLLSPLQRSSDPQHLQTVDSVEPSEAVVLGADGGVVGECGGRDPGVLHRRRETAVEQVGRQSREG